ncbi:lipopolysaccharide-induced tumor necrosis factor-alpha factor homolog isoform X2 [Apostichopus japonicus]|uniref:lipopolysaccharide-induced tumor necrosis factor-alpha factor homolog isoform X2 n=1 Tax=Stichopus japonicus TaxID=307972 RepID=UPI003AB5979E
MSAPTDAPPPYPDGEKADAPPYTEGTAYPPLLQQEYPPMGQPQLQQPVPGYPAQQPVPGYPGGYQQGGYPVSTQPMAGASTVHILQTHFRDMPVQTQCPNCHNHVTTLVTFEPGVMAWLMCFIMFLVGLWCCCCIPFCVNGLQDADHHCPTCRHRIAHYKPL